MKLVDKVQEEIQLIIMNKEYDTEGFIMNEGQIAERFNVSRGTVREAVRSLEIRGYVKRIHGKGLQVVNNTQAALTQSFADMLKCEEWNEVDLLEVREALEVSACVSVVSRITEKELSELEEIVKAMENDIDVSDEYFRNDFSFHLKFIKATKNQLLVALVNAYAPLLFNHIMSSTTAFRVNYELEYHNHRNIVEGLKLENVELTQHAMRQHLALTKKLLQDKWNQLR